MMFLCALSHGLWWVFPILIVAMMTICFLLMRGPGMSWRTGCFGRTRHRVRDESGTPPNIAT